MSDLPAGFVLDQPPVPPSVNGLPPGFVLDSQPQTSAGGYQPGQFWHNAEVEAQPFIAAGYNAIKPFEGMAQGLEHLGGAAGIIPQSTVSSDDAGMAAREKYYQANVPDNLANNTAAVVGGIAPYIAGGFGAGLSKLGTGVAEGAAKLVPQAVADYMPEAIAKLAPKIVSGVTQGAAVGAMSPVTDAGSYADQKAGQMETGAAIGGAVPSLVSTARGAGNLLKPFTNPNQIVGEALSKWAGSDPETIAKLKSANELVPGSSPTTAQVIANPDIVQAEKALSNNPQYKGQFMDRDIANNDARWQAVQNAASTPQQLAQAIKDRSAAAAEWVGAPATATTPAVSGKLQNGNPVPVQPIIDALTGLKNAPISIRPTVTGAANDILGELQNRSFQVQGASKELSGYSGGGAPPMAISPGDLDALRQNVRDYLVKNATNGAVSSQQEAALAPVKNAITDAIEQANPGYRNYLANFAKNSIPINDMQAAQGILDSNLANRGANASGAPQINLGGFNTQLAKALDTPYGISPELENNLTNIQKDLQRGTISNSVRVPGSDTGYNLQAPGWIGKQVYGSEFGGASPALKWGAGALGAAAEHANPVVMFGTAAAGYKGVDMLAGYAGRKVNNLLADALLNPSKAADLIQGANQMPKNLQIPEALLKKIPQLGELSQ